MADDAGLQTNVDLLNKFASPYVEDDKITLNNLIRFYLQNISVYLTVIYSLQCNKKENVISVYYFSLNCRKAINKLWQ